MKKLISSIALALIPLVLSILMLAFPSRIVTVVFFMLSLYILLGSLRELYVVLKVDELPAGIRNVSVIKNAINIILSVIVIFMAFSNPGILMDIVVYIVAVDLLLTAISDTIDSIILRRMGFRDILALDVILRYVFSAIMFFFPSFISSTFINIVAIIILILSVLYIVLSIVSYRRRKDEIFVEYEERE